MKDYEANSVFFFLKVPRDANLRDFLIRDFAQFHVLLQMEDTSGSSQPVMHGNIATQRFVAKMEKASDVRKTFVSSTLSGGFVFLLLIRGDNALLIAGNDNASGARRIRL